MELKCFVIDPAVKTRKLKTTAQTSLTRIHFLAINVKRVLPSPHAARRARRTPQVALPPVPSLPPPSPPVPSLLPPPSPPLSSTKAPPKPPAPRFRHRVSAAGFRRRSHRVSATGFDEITAFQPPYFTTIFFTAIFSPLHFYYPFPPQPFNNFFNTKKSYIKNIAKFTTTHNATHPFFLKIIMIAVKIEIFKVFSLFLFFKSIRNK